MTRMHFVFAVVAVSTGCVPANSLMDTSHPRVGELREKSRTVGASQVGAATTIYNFMTSTGFEQEAYRDFLMDEATIDSLTETEVCFALTTRTEFGEDVHASQWELTLDGAPLQAEETEPLRDVLYPLQQTTRTTRSGTTVVTNEPQGGYTIRHARACAPRPVGARALHLQLAFPQSDTPVKWGQRFTWILDGAPPAPSAPT